MAEIAMPGINEKALSLQQVADLLGMSYGTVYARRHKIGFQLPDSRIWRIWPSTLASLRPRQYNVTRLTPQSETENICQSGYAVKHGGSISARQTASELDNLLKRGTGKRRKSCTTA